MRVALPVRIMSGLCIGALAPLACVAPLRAQALRVGENERVAHGLERRPLVEPHLAAHPAKRNHLLAAAIVSDAAAGDLAQESSDTQFCASFLSVGGGSTWMRHDFAVAGCYDPWVALTPDGHIIQAPTSRGR